MLSEGRGRSISSVLADTVQNVQDIVRSEFRIARTELGEEMVKAKSGASLLAAVALCGFFAALFALFAAVYGLSQVMAEWAAALIVAGVMAVAAAWLLCASRLRLKQLHKPQRTVETVKENIQWVKQQAR